VVLSLTGDKGKEKAPSRGLVICQLPVHGLPPTRLLWVPKGWVNRSSSCPRTETMLAPMPPKKKPGDGQPGFFLHPLISAEASSRVWNPEEVRANTADAQTAVPAARFLTSLKRSARSGL
jgi:hypothetical protein